MQQIFKPFYFAITLLVMISITGCSGGNPFGAAGTGTGTGTGTGETASVIRIGSSSTGTFIDGTLQITPNTISAGGSTVVTAELVDSTGTAVTSNVSVNFSSPCVNGGLASLSNPTFVTTNGFATTNYLANGCIGSDIVTATINGTTQSASGTITVASSTAGSIQFDSASETLIALAGTGSASGLPENTTITFIVKDGLGLPVQGENVSFSLNSTLGGINLSSATGTSDGSGMVFTTVQSGSVATSVRVTATLDSNTSLTTTSNAISIATGPPDQNSISLAASELNPQAWNHDFVEVTITVGLDDRFNNPITDGTAVSFTTELGGIDPSCTTVNGRCSVIWRSKSPRTNSLTVPGPPGITTIIATVEGEESFTDGGDGNGVFSDGDSFTDLPEAFADFNDNGTYDLGEFFVDFNTDAGYNAGNGLYNGKGCTHSTDCDTISDAVTVRKSVRLVLAEDNPDVFAVSLNGNALCTSASDCSVANNYPDKIILDQNLSMSFTIGGQTNGQILPAGTTIKFTTTNGTIESGGSQTVASGVNSADTYSVFISRDNPPNDNDGFLTIEVDANGLKTTLPVIELVDPRTVGGTVSFTSPNQVLTIRNTKDSGASVEDLTLTDADGDFVFNTLHVDGSTYDVSIETQPATDTCSIVNGMGTVSGSNITNISINCL